MRGQASPEAQGNSVQAAGTAGAGRGVASAGTVRSPGVHPGAREQMGLERTAGTRSQWPCGSRRGIWIISERTGKALES